MEKQFRDTHPWEHARWVDDFDSKIREFADRDETKPILSRRVIIAEPEQGFQKADKLLSSPRGQGVAQRLRNLYNRRFLPPGISDKADKARADGKSVPRAILRDVYNHSDALISADARVAAAPSEHMAVLLSVVPDQVVPGVTSVEPSGAGLASSADVREAAQMLKKVKPIFTTSELRKFLKSSLRKDLNSLMYSPRSGLSLNAHLVVEVRKATEAVSIIDQVFPSNDPITSALTIGGLLLSLTALGLTHKPDWLLISAAIEAAKPPLRKYSLIPEAVQPGHPARALFYFTFGTRRPVRKQVQKLLSDIESHEYQSATV